MTDTTNRFDYRTTVNRCWEEMHSVSDLTPAMQEMLLDSFTDPKLVVFKAWPEASQDDFTPDGSLEGQSTIRVVPLVMGEDQQPVWCTVVADLVSVPVIGERRAEWELTHIRGFQLPDSRAARDEAIALAREFATAWKRAKLQDDLEPDTDLGFVSRASSTRTALTTITNSPR